MAVAHQEQVIYELRHVARVSWKLETRKPSFSGLAWRGAPGFDQKYGIFRMIFRMIFRVILLDFMWFDGIWWDFMVIELDFAGFIHVIS